MGEELDVAVGAPQRRDHDAHHGRSGRLERGHDSRQGLAPESGIRITPRPRDAAGRPASNCGFTRTTRSAPGAASEPVAGHGAQRDERQVGDHDVERLAAGSKPRTVADIGPLQRADPGVAPEPLVELAPAHVDRHDRGCAVLERQSVNPPVDAPASSTPRPVGVDREATRAASSLSPPRPTKRGGGAVTTSARPAPTSRDGLSAAAPPTSTWPERRSCAAASARLAARPRRTSSASRRRLVARRSACRVRSDGFAGRGLPR